MGDVSVVCAGTPLTRARLGPMAAPFTGIDCASKVAASASTRMERAMRAFVMPRMSARPRDGRSYGCAGSLSGSGGIETGGASGIEIHWIGPNGAGPLGGSSGISTEGVSTFGKSSGLNGTGGACWYSGSRLGMSPEAGGGSGRAGTRLASTRVNAWETRTMTRLASTRVNAWEMRISVALYVGSTTASMYAPICVTPVASTPSDEVVSRYAPICVMPVALGPSVDVASR